MFLVIPFPLCDPELYPPVSAGRALVLLVVQVLALFAIVWDTVRQRIKK
jgi:hypothetical protein